MVVQTAAEPETMAATITSVARSVDRDVPVSQVRTMDDVLSGSLAEPRVYTWLLGVFASLALALAAVGMYGVVSYSVTQRTHEMGSMALGAAPGSFVRLVLRQGLGLTLAGAAVGLLGAIAAIRLFSKLMPGTPPSDPAALAGAVLLLVGVAVVASLLPARRAARVDPMVALRDQ